MLTSLTPVYLCASLNVKRPKLEKIVSFLTDKKQPMWLLWQLLELLGLNVDDLLNKKPFRAGMGRMRFCSCCVLAPKKSPFRASFQLGLRTSIVVSTWRVTVFASTMIENLCLSASFLATRGTSVVTVPLSHIAL